MKTIYKYIWFEKIKMDRINKKEDWLIYNRGSNAILGKIEYYSQWRQYVLCSENSIIWSKNCLLDVIDFIKQI